MSDLAQPLLIKHNSTVGLADRLVAQGLMVREPIPDDRRKAQLRLTRQGRDGSRPPRLSAPLKLRRMGPEIQRDQLHHGFLRTMGNHASNGPIAL